MALNCKQLKEKCKEVCTIIKSNTQRKVDANIIIAAPRACIRFVPYAYHCPSSYTHYVRVARKSHSHSSRYNSFSFVLFTFFLFFFLRNDGRTARPVHLFFHSGWRGSRGTCHFFHRVKVNFLLHPHQCPLECFHRIAWQP